MPYTVTRQLQWPEGTPVVEISAGGLDYANPDMLAPQYPGEGETYQDPREAVEAAIGVCERWRREGRPDAQVGVGATGGMTLPFEPCSYEEARAWAERAVQRLPRCGRCGEVLPPRPFVHRELPDEEFCSEYCAEEAYEDLLSSEPVEYQVCDSCLTEAYGLGVRGKARQARLMAEAGAELPDHACDAAAEPDTRCDCGCRRGHRSEPVEGRGAP